MNDAMPRRQRRAKAPTTPDPIEIAMEAEAAGAPASGEAALLLRDQRRLIGWQIAGERAGLAVKALTALAGAILLVAAGAFVWSAAHEDGVVVEPFDTPPAMAEQGMTGAVIAGQVLDRVKAMQGETQTIRAVATYGSGWGEGLKVAIPNTGVSLDELQRYLADWLGHQTRVTGEVFQAPDGQLRVTTRVGGAGGETAIGPAATLDDLLGKSAEAIYRKSQPFLYARWLDGKGRRDEANAILRQALSGPDRLERVWALYGLANQTEDRDEGRRYDEAALRLDPDFIPALADLAEDAGDVHLERGLQLRRQWKAKARQFVGQVKPDLARQRLAINDTTLAVFLQDYAAAARNSNRVLAFGGGYDMSGVRSAQHAILAHDFALAQRILDSTAMSAAQLDARLATLGPDVDPRPFRAFALGDWAAAAQATQPMWASLRAGTYYRTFYPVALARAGRIAEAEAAVAALNPASDLTVIARAIVADAAGRRAEADALFRQAIARMPSIPIAHGAWADALLRRGDYKGAILQAKLAERKGPRWPDPWMTEGQALMALSRPKAALAAYAAAAERAPNWGALQLAWGEALAAAGQPEEARRRWRAAESLDLSPADRARVQARLAGRLA